MIAPAISPTEARYRSTPSVSFALQIRSLTMDIPPIPGSRLGSSISRKRVSVTEVALAWPRGRRNVPFNPHLASEADNEYAMLDSTIVRAHQHGAGAPKKR